MRIVVGDVDAFMANAVCNRYRREPLINQQADMAVTQVVNANALYVSVFAAALHLAIKIAFRDWKQPIIQANVILHLQILLDFVCQKERHGDSAIEWKLNWPDTCDDLGKVTPTIKWRKNK